RHMRELSRLFLGKNTYLTYPHMNGYVEYGRALIYRQSGDDGIDCLRIRDLIDGTDRVLWEFERDGHGGTTWEVALDSPKVAMVLNNQAVILDLEHPDELTVVHTPAPGRKLDGLCSLTTDGSRLLLREDGDCGNTALEIDLVTGGTRKLFSIAWYANHFHYCPHDPEWVAFSHEGRTEDIPDRCWVWHPQHAPQGRLTFDQASEVPDVQLCVGHEHWCFHDVSAYAPAYMHSPAGPRGLYEIFGDGRPAILRWKSDTIWHCTMDLTGRFVAVDTAGPFREEPYTDRQYRENLEIFKRKDAAGDPMDAEVAVLDLKSGKSLWLAQAQWTRHPYHPHPAISPNSRWVAWNDSLPERKGVWLSELSLGTSDGSN
ncbi:MAG: hypothetical protein PF795_11410, partial [Kiritimatiellae bacterium]|nr:hypothetical protein [Kiritimatiellia bacterium]